METMTKNVTDLSQHHMANDQKPVTTEQIFMEVLDKRETYIHVMLKNNEQTWSGQLGELNVTEMRVDLTPVAKPVKYTPFCAVPKTGDL